MGRLPCAGHSEWWGPSWAGDPQLQLTQPYQLWLTVCEWWQGPKDERSSKFSKEDKVCILIQIRFGCNDLKKQLKWGRSIFLSHKKRSGVYGPGLMETQWNQGSGLLLTCCSAWHVFHSQGYLMIPGTAVTPAITSSFQEARGKKGKKGPDHSFIRRLPGIFQASLISLART